MSPAPPPTSSPVEHVPGWLALVRRRVVEAIRRRQAEGESPDDDPDDADQDDPLEPLERLLARAGGPIARSDETATIDPGSPLGLLAARLRLTGTELELVALLLACETDPLTSRLVAWLGGQPSQRTPTIELAFEIVYRPHDDLALPAAALLYRDLAPDRRLRRLGFVVVEERAGRVALAHPLRLHPRVTAWLLGEGRIDADLALVATVRAPEPPEAEPDPDALEAAVAALSAGGRLLLLEGPPRCGRELLLEAAAARLGAPLLVLRAQAATPLRILAAFREACLLGAQLAVRDLDGALPPEQGEAIAACLAAWGGTLSIITAGRASPALLALRPVTRVAVAVPPHERRAGLWRRFLGPGPEETQIAEHASIYNLGTAGILAAAAAARESARFLGRAPSRNDVRAAVRGLFDGDLARIGTHVEPTQTLDDLVLPPELQASLGDLMDRIRYRAEVLGRWGFARKLGKGLAVTALFSGEPGTGKSMAASVVAAALGLDLYAIDLSRITSKWLGETEKNLALAFDAAEAGHAILLFDEADSVLGKRASDIRSANDRHANLETNFVLARLEQFQGIAFFTTNLPSAIDPAIARRISLRLHFPFPDAEQRAELWRRLLPPEAPVTDDVDFERLGERFELSGGFIRNIVLRAAFAVAREDRPIRMDDLESAAEREYTDRGALVIGGKLA